MNNDKSYFELKDWDGHFYPIARRKKDTSKIDECPFCGEQHTHAFGIGHRHAHCTDTHGFFKEIIIKGKTLLQEQGYFIEEY